MRFDVLRNGNTISVVKSNDCGKFVSMLAATIEAAAMAVNEMGGADGIEVLGLALTHEDISDMLVCAANGIRNGWGARDLDFEIE